MDSKSEEDFFIESFPVGPLQCNCSIIGDLKLKKCLVIDPGGDPEKILKIIKNNQFTVVAILHTHAHLDHILASGIIKKETEAPLYLNENDKFLWEMIGQQCQMFGIPEVKLPKIDGFIKDDQHLGCCDCIAIHTPGHTPGSMSFIFDEYKVLVAGDTLFKGSIGRTDLPGGDFNEIVKSIRDKLYSLDDELTVITGHGPSTKIGIEKTENMFVREL